MPLVGQPLQPREIVEFAYVAFKNAGHEPTAIELVESVCICYAESDGYPLAYHDNLDPTTKIVTSRDTGLWEIEIPAAEIGTATEKALYDPANNAAAMVDLYLRRGWEPWVSFRETTYLYDPYLGHAVQGVANWIADQLLSRPALMLDGATPYAHILSTPVVDFRFRLAAAVGGLSVAETELGWSAKSASQVTKIHQGLAAAYVAAKAGLPNPPH